MLAWCASPHRTESSIFIIDHSRLILDVCAYTPMKRFQESAAGITKLFKGKFDHEQFFYSHGATFEVGNLT